jgi:choline dehydrogenase-like flavoprotein
MLAELRALDPFAMLSNATVNERFFYPGLTAARTSSQLPLPYMRGRGVGGSSAINGLFAIRPLVEDLDGWARAGCAGWSFGDALPYLKRLEHDLDFADAPYHGACGPIPVVRPKRKDWGIVDVGLHEAAVSLGEPQAPDHNAPNSSGVSPFAYTARDGARVTTNDAYLEVARDRHNLVVCADTTVDTVVVSKGRALGVRVQRDRETIEFLASETVLSAGAIHSPAILLRSGIGPAADLRSLGISVVEDLPVGRGLQDHPALLLGFSLKDGAELRKSPRHGNVCLRCDSGIGAVQNDLMFVSLNYLGQKELVGALVGWVNHAKSLGSVTLASRSPNDQPVVSLNMLSHPEDVARMRVVLQRMAEISTRRSFAAIATSSGIAPAHSIHRPPKRLSSTLLALDRLPQGSDLVDFMRRNTLDTQHASASCRMGAVDDSSSVVDPTCSVLGIDGLRVVDASIMPWAPSANTHLTTLMIAEIAADIIDGTRRSPQLT